MSKPAKNKLAVVTHGGGKKSVPEKPSPKITKGGGKKPISEKP